MDNDIIARLLTIMQTLRNPQGGCPWDCEQTFATVAPHTLEEAYEVVDAIERQDYDELRVELGDLLFQVIFHAQMAQEQKMFNFYDVCQALSNKLIQRHPHVFADGQVDNATDALAQWEALKISERAEKQQHSLLDDIPNVLPALMKAEKIQQRCATVGFDWASWQPVLDKVHEELTEVQQELHRDPRDQTKLAEELGDLLFSVVNLTRHLGHQAETVLQAANRKFSGRFALLEQEVAKQGKTMTELSLREMDQIWQRIKRDEG